MNYAYPKLSEKDFIIARIGGAGLGNILFPYARAVVFAKKHNTGLIWPTWFSIKLGPILRRENDKRFYNDLFDNNSGCIDGIRKWFYLITKKKMTEEAAKSKLGTDDTIIEFTGFNSLFSEIMEDSKIVYEDLKKNLKKKNRKALEYDFSNSISVHVRLGDFGKTTEAALKAGANNCSLPIAWYIDIINQVRQYTGKTIKVYIFSDGTDSELKSLLDLPGVERITFGSSIADIIALSRTSLFVASGSSFSLWARYLGRMDTICYKNQLKQRLMTFNDSAFEIETDGIIEISILEKIKHKFEEGGI